MLQCLPLLRLIRMRLQSLLLYQVRYPRAGRYFEAQIDKRKHRHSFTYAREESLVARYDTFLQPPRVPRPKPPPWPALRLLLG